MSKKIQGFVALDGYEAQVRIPAEGSTDGSDEVVQVAGVALVEQEWVACALGSDGVLVPLEDLGEVIDVALADDEGE